MTFFKKSLAPALLGAAVAMSSNALADGAETLSIEVFNPGAKSLFPVSSTLVAGPEEAVLIDAQFQRDDAQSVLKMIQDSGKDLTTIYISHGDPDFYFGLDVITAAYPEAKVVASPETLAHIRATVEKKISYWGPILSENAPRASVEPERLAGDTLTVDGAELKIIGLDGHDPKHSFVWIPSAGVVTGGVVVYEGVHVWMADAKTLEARENWRKTLADLLALDPKRIIPGHFIGESDQSADAVAFTLEYLTAFEEEAAKAADAAGLTAAMQARYPAFGNIGDLELSAKVVMGEMQWP